MTLIKWAIIFHLGNSIWLYGSPYYYPRNMDYNYINGIYVLKN